MINKNKKFIISIISILCLSLFLICSKCSDNVILDEVKLKENSLDKKMFAIMLEKTDNSNEYEQSKENIFPGAGYLYNSSKSGCIDSNNNEIKDVLEYNNDTKKISVRTNTSVYCYLYFKKDSKVPNSNIVTLKGTAENGFTLTDGYTHTTKVSVSTSWTDDDVECYCINMENNSNNCKWENVEGQSIIDKDFAINDIEGPQTVYVYLKDKSGNISDSPESATITLDKTNPVITKTTKTSDEETKIIFNVEITENGYAGAGISTLTCSSGNYSCTCDLTLKTCTLSGLSAGTSHSIIVTATDLSGRIGTKNETYQTKALPTPGQIVQQNASTTDLKTSTIGDLKYRFVGTNPNNYICFGSGTQCSSSDNYMYRIVGITSSGALKLQLNKSLGSKIWHTSAETNTTWNSSSLKQSLNGADFLNNSLYILNDDWKNLILSTSWTIGDIGDNDKSNAETVYKAESQKYVYSTKIGLIYLSDYYLAYDNGLGTRDCGFLSCSNWLHRNTSEWTMSRYYSGGSGWGVFRIYTDGKSNATNPDLSLVVRPVFYLSSQAKIINGEGNTATKGSISNPYIVVLP